MKMAKAKVLPSSWEELPVDLLDLVVLRLASLADRVRLRAVCRSWRAGAQQRKFLPPPLPWLALRDGGMVDLEGAPIRCDSILREGVFRYRAVDNLAFLIHDDGASSLMNPLSGLRLPLPPKLAPAIRRALDQSPFHSQSVRSMQRKVILSSPLDSTSDPLTAVLIMEGFGVAVSACKQHDAISIRNFRTSHGQIQDIAFLHGKLFALTSKGLFAVEVNAGGLEKPESSLGFSQCIAEDPREHNGYVNGLLINGTGNYFMRYLAESDGRLLMVRRWMYVPQEGHVNTFKIEVFQADLAAIPCRWIKVESLCGQAIFLGSDCSKSVLASQYPGGVQENCIYFLKNDSYIPCKNCLLPCVDPLVDSGVYNIRDGKITPLLPEAVMEDLRRKQQSLTWFFPADA